MKDMRLSCTCAVSADNALPIAGSVGRYISMANGPMTDNSPSTTPALKILVFIIVSFRF